MDGYNYILHPKDFRNMVFNGGVTTKTFSTHAESMINERARSPRTGAQRAEIT